MIARERLSMHDSDHDTQVRQAGEGNGQALEHLLERHLPNLRAYIRLHADPMIRERESCTDLAQSVCREALEDMQSFRDQGEAPFRKWLFTRAMSKLVDRRRYYLADKRSPAREVKPAAWATDSLPMPWERLSASFLSPCQVAIRNEDLESLERAFDQLPENYQKVITHSRLIGQSHAEIAAELGSTEGAVRILLHRAVVRLGWLMNRQQ